MIYQLEQSDEHTSTQPCQLFNWNTVRTIQYRIMLTNYWWQLFLPLLVKQGFQGQIVTVRIFRGQQIIQNPKVEEVT